jgi:para-aminobenzoate synthetase component 1
LNYSVTYPIPSDKTLVAKSLLWAQQFEMVQYTTNNGIAKGFKQLLGIQFKVNPKNQSLPSLHKNTWQLGFIGYDYKNQLENAYHQPKQKNTFEFPDLYFFEPDILICFEDSQFTIHATTNNTSVILAEIENTFIPVTDENHQVKFQPDTNFNTYEEHFNTLKNHILQGDIYITNYCIALTAQNSFLNPVQLYLKLNQQTPTPFSSFIKYQDQYLICASPERFLKKEGQQLISQPIKGTAPRGNSEKEDHTNKTQLQNSIKEKTENVMVVDLVRNDLSRICDQVNVTELFGIYSFETVHQMISTITGKLKENTGFKDIIKATFPMGSMTGAPKINAVNSSVALENFNRELYSGTVGYITPEGDFDFNVIIRSILHDSKSNSSSIRVGSAITYNTTATQEWDECLLKARSLLSLFKPTSSHGPWLK